MSTWHIWSFLQVNFRIYRVGSGKPQKRISQGLRGEGGVAVEEKSSPSGGGVIANVDDANDTDFEEIENAKEGDQSDVRAGADDDAPEGTDDQLAQGHPEQTRPLPFVDETVQEGEEEEKENADVLL